MSNGLVSVLDDGGRRREVPCIDGVVRTMLAADETLDLTGEASLVVREVWVNSPEDEPFSGRRTVEGRVRLPTTTRPSSPSSRTRSWTARWPRRPRSNDSALRSATASRLRA